MRMLTNNELDLIAGGFTNGYDDEIVVTGYRRYDATFWTPDPYSGGGGGGGNGSAGAASNTDYVVSNDDAPCENEAAIAAGAQIQGIVNTVGSFEFTGLLGLNPNGTYGLLDNELSTTFSTTDSSFDPRDSYADVFGIIHNHPPNPSNYSENFLNRYPSDADWDALQTLINGGANPNNLSLFIIDPFGTMREFNWNDRQLFKNMTDSQRYDLNGPNLPAATKACH